MLLVIGGLVCRFGVWVFRRCRRRWLELRRVGLFWVR